MNARCTGEEVAVTVGVDYGADYFLKEEGGSRLYCYCTTTIDEHKKFFHHNK